MSMISAHGKVILFGEHAAVYGRPALAAGIYSGIRVISIEPTNGPLRVRVRPWNLDQTDQSDSPVGECLRRLSQIVQGDQRGCNVVLKAEIPAAAGMGSSAALAVVLVRCLCRVREFEASNEQVRQMAHQLEKVFHGEPSGLDDTVATYGDVCLFRRNGWDRQTLLGLSYCSLTPQALRVPCRKLTLLVGYSGVKRSTRKMVAKVRQLRCENKARVEKLFDKIENCLSDGLDAISTANNQKLGESLFCNHQVLTKLGVSCAELDQMVELAMSAGASGAKLTGAGGGGGVIAEASGHEEMVLAAWRSHCFEGQRVVLTGNNTD
ncbi:MAG: mevalonate kinase [Deltaproteobacteria bacterium]|nr:mevalonate kinase [Deltaproteobacteria bacterium]